MKRIPALLLTGLLAVSVCFLTACQKNEDGGVSAAGETTAAAVSVPDDLTPYSVNADGSATSYLKTDLDDDGRVIRSYTYDSLGQLCGSTGFEYDENGNVVKEIMYNEEDAITAQTLYEKTPEDLVTKRTDLNSKGEVTAVSVYEYTDAGFESATYKYDGDDNLLSYRLYEYDEEDNLVQMTVYGAGGEVESTTIYTDNDDGTFTESKYDGDGNLISSK